MIVYKDIISNDEMITSAYKQDLVYDKEGLVIPGMFQVESSMKTKGSESIDIGCGNSFGGGEEEIADNSVEKVNDIIDSFSYTEVPFGNKQEFKEYITSYMRSIRTKLKEKGTPQVEIKEFMTQAPGMVKFLLGKFSDMQTFAGESLSAEGGMGFGFYKDGAHCPSFVYITKALVAEKF